MAWCSNCYRKLNGELFCIFPISGQDDITARAISGQETPSQGGKGFFTAAAARPIATGGCINKASSSADKIRPFKIGDFIDAGGAAGWP